MLRLHLRFNAFSCYKYLFPLFQLKKDQLPCRTILEGNHRNSHLELRITAENVYEGQKEGLNDSHRSPGNL